MRSIKQLILLWMVSSLVACAGIEKPDAEVCIVNAPAFNRKCYNLKTDYDENGKLRREAVAKYKPNVHIKDLNKATVLDSETGFEDGLAEVKAYIKNLREAYEKKEKKMVCE